MATALGFSEVHQALAFLESWPALEKAAALVLARATELNGDHYEALSSAADALTAKYPLAAILILRAMIDFSLKRNRVKRYRHAARHLAECESLATAVGDFRNFEPHEHHAARLKSDMGERRQLEPVGRVDIEPLCRFPLEDMDIIEFLSVTLAYQAAADGLGVVLGQLPVLCPEFGAQIMVRLFDNPIRQGSYHAVWRAVPSRALKTLEITSWLQRSLEPILCTAPQTLRGLRLRYCLGNCAASHALDNGNERRGSSNGRPAGFLRHTI